MANTVVRINISVPKYIRDRMNNYNINWSAVATAAFIKLMDMKDNKVPLSIEERIIRLEQILGI